MADGLFIVLEGIDGSGTSTHMKRLANWLSGKGIPVLTTSEPTRSGTGRLLRIALRDKSLPPAVDALLFAADRVEHSFRKIKPALKKGKVVICDRYVESSIAYQSVSDLPLEWVKTINQYALTPDLTIILDIAPEISLKRKSMYKPREKFETIPFLSKVRQIYISRAEENDFVVINAEGSIEDVQAQIRNLVSSLLEKA